MKKSLFTLFFVISILSVSAQNFDTDSVPARLGYFNVIRTGNAIRLNWTVVCLLDYANFDIQRSQDAIHYISIANFKADKLRCSQPFNYDDNTTGGAIYYRIRVGDLDGRYYSSKVVAVYNKIKGFDITGLTPTLVNSKALLALSSSENTTSTITITAFQGNIAKRMQANLTAGNNELLLDLSTLSKGSYILSVVNAEKVSKTTRFIKQ